MAKIVDLFNEVTLKSTRLTVSNNDFKVLGSLNFLGGFKRFGLSLYDDVKGSTKRQKTEMLNFLDDVFQNKDLVKTYFK